MTGKMLAHYELGDRLGEGGSGVVYQGRDLRLDRTVAIKVLADALRDDELAWARLLREARLASQLNHPHIAAVYDLGEDDGRAYIVMEYVEGLPLADLIPEGGMPAEQVRRYAVQIADTLAYAHEHGTLHGDLKGSNIVVTPEGNVKLLDFGLGRRIPRHGMTEVTSSSQALAEAGTTAGTLPYIAPEVLRGDATSVQSDAWALGVLIYQMATGELPFRGATAFDLSLEIMTATPPRLALLPEPLQSAVRRCLEKDPAARVPGVAELAAALKEDVTRVEPNSPDVGEAASSPPIPAGRNHPHPPPAPVVDGRHGIGSVRNAAGRRLRATPMGVAPLGPSSGRQHAAAGRRGGPQCQGLGEHRFRNLPLPRHTMVWQDPDGRVHAAEGRSREGLPSRRQARLPLARGHHRPAARTPDTVIRHRPCVAVLPLAVHLLQWTLESSSWLMIGYIICLVTNSHVGGRGKGGGVGVDYKTLVHVVIHPARLPEGGRIGIQSERVPGLGGGVELGGRVDEGVAALASAGQGLVHQTGGGGRNGLPGSRRAQVCKTGGIARSKGGRVSDLTGANDPNALDGGGLIGGDAAAQEIGDGDGGDDQDDRHYNQEFNQREASLVMAHGLFSL